MNIEQLEVLRKKAKNTQLGIFALGVIFTIVISIILQSFLPLLFGVVLSLIISFIISAKPTREFTLAFKKAFVLTSLQSAFSNLVYEPEKGLDESVIAATGMMDMGDSYSSNDYVSGKYKDISVEQADVHIQEEQQTTDSDGNTTTTWVTIFMGRWMIFDFNKTFKANVQVCQKGFGNARRKNFGSKLKYKKVMMEDQAFNNQFRVYAQDDHDAFYILTPSLMEKIKNLSNHVTGKLLLCFVDNKLHVGIDNNKDSFEHSIYKKIDEAKVIEAISKDIKVITDFVDELNLDNDLFRKGV